MTEQNERPPSLNERADTAGRSLHDFIEQYFRTQSALVPIAAIFLALVVAGVILLVIGEDPIEGYWALLRGMFGSWDRVAASLARSTPFIGAALGVAFAFKAGLFNIGVEGQLLIGATAAAWVGTFSVLDGTPGIVAVPLVLVAGILGGLIWGGIPGVLKARTGAHEVITTIMLNNIAVLYVRWLVGSQDPLVLRDPAASVPHTRRLPESVRLPEIIDSSPPLHWGFLVMLLLVVFVWFVLRRTDFGFEVRTIGKNADAAAYAGMSVSRTIIITMALAGAFAGLAGAGEIAGTSGYLSPGVFATIGFDSIAIALLARANPFGIILAAGLWGSMLSGAGLMQQQTGISIDLVRVVQALVLLFVAADVIVRTIFRIRKERVGEFETTQITSGWGST